MKERIVIPKDKIKVLTSGSRFPANGYFTFYKEDVEVEQVPENWEELKELCKDLKGNKKDCGGAMWFEFGCLNNDKMYLGKFLCVDEKGQVGITERSWGGDISITIFAQNRTPQQMWQIIKSLIGE